MNTASQFYILQFRKVDTNTLEGRKRLIDGFVNSVVVYDDYILVTFNYKEGTERITFEQIERSDLSSLGGPKEEAKKDIGQKSPVFSRLPRPVDQRIYGPHFFDISILDLRSGGTQTRILNEESATCFWPGSWMQDPGFSIL